MDGDGKAGAAFLKRFLADSIVRDFEHLRRTEFGGARWVTLGQSYGGFLTLTYLSLFPQGVIASFTTGGIPHVPADATDVYRHTFPRMAAKTKQFYERYPIDIERAAAVCRHSAVAQGRIAERRSAHGGTFPMLGIRFRYEAKFRTRALDS